MPDDKENKPGLFKRLFGWAAPEPPASPGAGVRDDRQSAARPDRRSDAADKPGGKRPSATTTPTSTSTPKDDRGASREAPAKPTRRGPAKRGSAKAATSGKSSKPARPARPPATDAGKVIPFPRPPAKPGPTPVPAETKPPVPLPRRPPAPPARPASEPPGPTEPKGWFARLGQGLARTSSTLGDSIQSIFAKRKLDADTLQDLEDALIQADLGVDLAARIADGVARGRYDKGIAADDVRRVLADEVTKVLAPVARPLDVDASKRPFVILVVGVNGAGKTTTIGKLASRFAGQGRRVVLAAGDTFRAAAIDQLKVWGERAGAEVVAREVGADAAGLAYDAVARARASDADVLLIDTAGRLQNKAHLMDELAKIVRVVKKIDDTAPHAVLLVLDATTGQNALAQAETFRDIAGVTGIVMTKLDGTARGGILVAIAERFALPVHAVGVGEGVDDLQPFEAAEFAAAIAGRRG